MYQESPVVADTRKALMAGELLWDDPTWGGDYKDEIKDGASTWGRTTSGFPSLGWTVETMYDRDLGGDDGWDKNDIFAKFNGGVNLVNHLGHCNWHYNMRFYDADVNTTNFTNDGITNGFYTTYFLGLFIHRITFFPTAEPDQRRQSR